MAKLLSTGNSAALCLNNTRRHQRLSKQVVNDETLSQQIQPAADDTRAKMAIVAQMAESRENAYDDVVLSDRNLDDDIRSNFEDCKKYNRDNPAELVLSKIFPDEKFGEIVRLPFLVEVGEAQKIVRRIESLGAEHPLFSNAGKLSTKIAAVTSAIDAHNAAIREEKMAEADVEIAKEVLIRQYEANYLDARKKYGRNTAEKLFPKIYSYSRGTEVEEIPELPVPQP